MCVYKQVSDVDGNYVSVIGWLVVCWRPLTGGGLP